MHSATQQQHGRGGGEQQQSPSVLPADMPPVPTSMTAKRPDLFGAPDPHQPAASAPPRPSAPRPSAPCPSAHDDLSPAGDAAAAAAEAAAAAAQQQQGSGGGGGGMVAGSRPGATAATAATATAAPATAATAKGAPPENGLDAIIGDTQQWALHAATLQKFQSVEEEHLSCEEAEVIEPLRAVMSQGEMAKLGRQWSSAWANAPTHPHPRGPSAAPGAALLHPLVGVVDRLRDAVVER
ncbi:hypothetical protein CHLRE_15g639552v5 [Chlamydomonas reinhardtii]|uniref:Hemerythrin-like domain-containing protein n=1 Tax=Chlamydomonas reinhardtii TaxID=3055 RepID=A0A2K3CWQ0_CHLRE|nr:uncharacterized protein CHLRE_15g639552v5 [Chlamydomonas reinhardtii]PNW72705.1 hypothetical protein CHLRE_15g639552v5 [Chlamydomonas reinhardtii]